MAFALDGVISKDEIRNLFIPSLEKALVGKNFLNLETVLDAESIKIPGVADVAVLDYTGNAVTSDATDTSVTLLLDQAKYFQKSIDKVDNAQAAVKIIGKVLERGAYATAEAIDEFIFALLGSATNTVPGVAIDDTNVMAWLTSMNTALTNQKAPKGLRRLAVTPELGAIIAEANYGFNTTTAEEAVRTGFVGRAGGFEIFETLSLADGAATGKMAVATVSDAGTLGLGYSEYDVTEPSLGFKWIAKGLANYGGKISQQAYAVASDVTLA